MLSSDHGNFNKTPLYLLINICVVVTYIYNIEVKCWMGVFYPTSGLGKPNWLTKLFKVNALPIIIEIFIAVVALVLHAIFIFAVAIFIVVVLISFLIFSILYIVIVCRNFLSIHTSNWKAPVHSDFYLFEIILFKKKNAWHVHNW